MQRADVVKQIHAAQLAQMTAGGQIEQTVQHQIEDQILLTEKKLIVALGQLTQRLGADKQTLAGLLAQMTFVEQTELTAQGLIAERKESSEGWTTHVVPVNQP